MEVTELDFLGHVSSSYAEAYRDSGYNRSYAAQVNYYISRGWAKGYPPPRCMCKNNGTCYMCRMQALRRWADSLGEMEPSPERQQANERMAANLSKRYYVEGRFYTITELAKITGINRDNVYKAVKGKRPKAMARVLEALHDRSGGR